MKHHRVLSLILSLSIALASMAQAQTFLEPPPRFDRAYPGGTTVYFYPKSEMWTRCNKLARKQLPRHPAECGVVRISAKTGKKHCFVFINQRFKGTETGDLLRRHGRAHCNGWKHTVRKDHAQ